MSGEVITLPAAGNAHKSVLEGRISRAVELLQEIRTGELLAAFPDCPIAFENHRSALTLLMLLEVELVSACSDMAIAFAT